MPIHYHIEDVDFPLPDTDVITAWLLRIGQSEEKTIAEVTYIFCSDDYLLEINKTYLNHDYYTDIITFPYKQGKEIESDIFISVDRVKENAQLYSSSFEKELLRVMAHGLLHLMGYKDKTEPESNQMREKEEWAIGLYNSK